jgi:hypothetical protein
MSEMSSKISTGMPVKVRLFAIAIIFSRTRHVSRGQDRFSGDMIEAKGSREGE